MHNLSLAQIILLVLVVVLLFGGLGTRYGGWGGAGWAAYGTPGLSLGGILLIILIIWLLF